MHTIFKHKKAVRQQLLNYGFTEFGEGLRYVAKILNDQFSMIVTIDESAEVTTTVIDNNVNEEYILHLVPESTGAFVGQVRTEYVQALTDIAEKCFVSDVFKSPQAQAVVDYIRAKYDSDLEFLWPKFPNNAIWRRQDTNKWFGALLFISKTRLGLKDDTHCDVLNVMADPARVTELVDHQRYFPAYHMNKKRWISVCLDGALNMENIYTLIDDSYQIAAKK